MGTHASLLQPEVRARACFLRDEVPAETKNQQECDRQRGGKQQHAGRRDLLAQRRGAEGEEHFQKAARTAVKTEVRSCRTAGTRQNNALLHGIMEA